MRLRFAALLVGLVLVVLLEGALRLVPALRPPAFALLLATVEDRTLNAVNPDYPQSFFAGVAGDLPAGGVRMTPRPYVEPAPPEALRVLFAGGSTVQGFPHPKRLSAPSHLQEMLRDLHPGRPIEVFNAGITAASSFAVARAVEDGVRALEADLVVVYTGHNELYGVYGAASLAQGGRGLWSKRLHYGVMQWRMTRLVVGLLGAFGTEEAQPADLLETMSRTGSVPVDDPRRERAAVNLEGNLRDVAALCRERGIPLVLCTLTSNERGFAPARGDPPSGEDGAAYLDLLQAGSRGQAAAAALRALEEARELREEDAYLHFLRGHHLERLGDGFAARQAYLQARELDTRPWRATARLNEVVRRVAAEEGAILAEVEARFLDHSPAAGVGWELMADHLHPTAAGQALLARAVAAALRETPQPWGFPPQRLQQLQADNRYRQRLGDLPVEQLAVTRAMARLFASPPMDEGNESRAEDLRRRGATLLAGLSPGERRGVERWVQGEGPDLLALNVAEALFSAREYQRARAYYQASRLEQPFTIWSDLWATLRWVRCGRLLGRPPDETDRAALETVLDRLRFLARAPGFSQGLRDFVEGYARHLLGQGSGALAALEAAIRDEETRRRFFPELLHLLVIELIAAGRPGDAERYALQVSTELRQEAFGRALVERIRAGAAPR